MTLSAASYLDLHEKRRRLADQIEADNANLTLKREIFNLLDMLLGLSDSTPVPAPAPVPKLVPMSRRGRPPGRKSKPGSLKPGPKPKLAAKPTPPPKKPAPKKHIPTSPYMIDAAARIANAIETHGPLMYGDLAKKAFPDKSPSYIALGIKAQPGWFHQPGGKGTAWDLTDAGRNRPRALINATIDQNAGATNNETPQPHPQLDIAS